MASDRKSAIARTLAPQLEAVGEQAVLDSETIESDDTVLSDPAAHQAAPAPEPRLEPAKPSDEPDERIGELIHGRYRLIRKLGRGGMGTVYLAEHATIPKTFAIKLLNARYASRQEFAARFLLEAQAVSLIDHPNVVGIVDYGTTADGAAFLVMEHLRGESLEVLCRREAPLPWPRVRHLSLQVCRALQAAHEVGIVHRDIKPDNVLRLTRGDDRDYVKVLDFGLAKIQTGEGLRLTRTGMVLGTPRYMAPEQARGSKIDHRVDIYAVGILFYELLCGRTPFQATTFVQMRNQHLLSKPEAPSHWAPDAGITGEMDAIALRALAKDPDCRFASMAAMAEAIAEVGQGRGPVQLLEKSTLRLDLDTPSVITRRISASSGNRAGESTMPSSSIQLPSRWRPWLLPTLLGIGVAALVAGVAASLPDRPQWTTKLPMAETVPTAPIVLVTPLEPTSEFVALTLETNVPVRVLEARDQAILGDTEKSPTIALPRSGKVQKLLLRAEGHRDLEIEVTPDRDRSLSFTLEPAPASEAKPSKRASTPDTSAPVVADPPEPEPEPVKDNRFAPEIRDPFAKR